MSLSRLLNDAKDDLKVKEREFRTTLQKLSDDSSHRDKSSQLEIESLKDKVQTLEQKLFEESVKTKRDVENLQIESNKYEKETKLFADENRLLKNKIADLQQDIDRFQKRSQEDESQIEKVSKDLKQSKKEISNVQAQIKNYINTQEELERKIQKMSRDHERELREARDKPGQIEKEELARAYQKLKTNKDNEINSLKQKCKEYKDKVKVANEIIQNLGAKVGYMAMAS